MFHFQHLSFKGQIFWGTSCISSWWLSHPSSNKRSKSQRGNLPRGFWVKIKTSIETNHMGFYYYIYISYIYYIYIYIIYITYIYIYPYYSIISIYLFIIYHCPPKKASNVSPSRIRKVHLRSLRAGWVLPTPRIHGRIGGIFTYEFPRKNPCKMYPKNHGISKVFGLGSQNPAIESQIPLGTNDS